MNHSSTFVLNTVESHGREGMQVAQMEFGSGMVQGVIASDMVHIGGLKAFMNDTLVLMINSQLKLPDGIKFEGILGLGPPKNETMLEEQAKEQEKQMKEQQEQMEKLQKALGAKLRDLLKAKANKTGSHGDDDDNDDQKRVQTIDGADIAKALQAVL